RVAGSADDIRDFAGANSDVAIWLEATTPDGFDELIAASISMRAAESLIVPISGDLGGMGEMSRELKRLLESDRTFVAHDAKLQMRRLVANGWPVPRRWADTMIMSYVINPGLPSHSLGNVARDRLKLDVVSRKDVAKTAPLLALDHEVGAPIGPYQQYLGEKSDVALSLRDVLEPELRRDPALLNIYETILLHRELHKLKSTYVDALPQLVGKDGRVHTSFNQAVAATGRLSSSDPNLQNIPIRTEQGREIRKAFIADKGNVLMSADYSQVE